MESGLNLQLLSDARFPTEKCDWKLDELFKLTRGEILDEFSECIASLQLLRLYRELINVEISENEFNAKILESQINRNYENFFQSTLGTDLEINRMHKYYSRFLSYHFGISLVKNLSNVSGRIGDSFSENYSIPIPNLLFSFLEGSQTVPLSDETQKIIASFRSQFPELVDFYVENYNNRLKMQDGVIFIKEVLSRLGILSDEETAEEQIRCLLSGDKLSSPAATLTIYQDPKAKLLSINPRLGVIRIPVRDDYTYERLIKKVIMHEVIHFYQNLAVRNIGIPGVEFIAGFGRSAVLGESGAIKMQDLPDILKTRRTNRNVGSNKFHLTSLLKHMQGGNFWEVFNSIWENSSGKQRTFSRIYPLCMRVYSNIGGTSANSEVIFRFPSSYSLLRYMLQGMDEYADIPFYVSAIPSDKWMEFIKFFTKPTIDPEQLLFIVLDTMTKFSSKYNQS